MVLKIEGYSVKICLTVTACITDTYGLDGLILSAFSCTLQPLVGIFITGYLYYICLFKYLTAGVIYCSKSRPVQDYGMLVMSDLTVSSSETMYQDYEIHQCCCIYAAHNTAIVAPVSVTVPHSVHTYDFSTFSHKLSRLMN